MDESVIRDEHTDRYSNKYEIIYKYSNTGDIQEKLQRYVNNLIMNSYTTEKLYEQ